MEQWRLERREPPKQGDLSASESWGLGTYRYSRLAVEKSCIFAGTERRQIVDRECG